MSDKKASLSFEGNKVSAVRAYTPRFTVEKIPSSAFFMENAHPKGVDPMKFDIMVLKIPKTSAKSIQTVPKWDSPKLGRRVFVIGRDRVSSGCIDNIETDGTFDTSANVTETMSGGVAVDSESGKFLGVISVAYAEGGSGIVSLKTLLSRLVDDAQEGAALRTYLLEEMQPFSLILKQEARPRSEGVK